MEGVLADSSLVLSCRDTGGRDQRASGRWRLDHLPPVDVGHACGCRRRHERRRVGPRLPDSRVAHAARDRHDPPAPDLVAPGSERARWPGGGAVACLHERARLYLPGAVVDPGRYGAIRTRAEALPQEKRLLVVARLITQ